jgi:hypothetical protein
MGFFSRWKRGRFHFRDHGIGPLLGRGRRRALPAGLLLESLESRVVPSFVGPLSFDAGSYPWSVAAGDFNGDGVLDLAVANINSNNVSVLLGTGDGSFGVARNFSAASRPVSVGQH